MKRQRRTPARAAGTGRKNEPGTTEQTQSTRMASATATDRDTEPRAEAGVETTEAAADEAWGLQNPGQFMRFGNDGVGRMNERLLDDTSAMTGRIVEFGSQRLQEDIECMSELARCRSPVDVLSIQRRWMDTAIEDYRKAGTDLYGCGVRLFTDSVKAATELASGVFKQDIPRKP